MARRTQISLLWCVLALAVAGCGSGDDGTIPPDDADNLLTLLSDVEGNVADGNCDLAQQQAQEFVGSVGELPNDVDPEVADELTKAAANLDTLAQEPGECTETGATGDVGEQPATSTTEETVAPETTTESTTTSPEEDTSTTEEDTTTIEPTDEAPSEGPESQPPSQGPTEGGGVEPPSGGVTGGGSAG